MCVLRPVCVWTVSPSTRNQIIESSLRVCCVEELVTNAATRQLAKKQKNSGSYICSLKTRKPSPTFSILYETDFVTKKSISIKFLLILL